ncbi:F-box/FBD/LRR protein [Rhynchospora pubera]|uniref:F-box/FBD/LRR protein n=1 Tax=Rhynchospora pubera TaxID=906938 RepID=A0AAV8FM53_9POAL|nr:F-box/FBD/LRR protein [Rhynchospora pubera]
MESTDSLVDRISDLPDLLLTDILSLVTTKETVTTCVLSKRWTKLWAFVPVLDFRSNQFEQNNLWLGDQDHTKFLQFVKGVFDHREAIHLERFGFSFEGVTSRDIPHFIEILDRAAKCRPRVTSIDVSTVEYIQPPSSIFSCASIEEMSLSFDAPDTFVAPEIVNLPSLKKLELTCLSVYDNFIRAVLSGCPSLEELVMNCCILDIYEISSDTLKKLVLNMCVLLGEVYISCPAAVSLSIKHPREAGIRLNNVSPLARADICFEDTVFDEYAIGIYVNLLRDLPNIASLRLHTTCLGLQALLVAHVPKFQAFENLRILELEGFDMTCNFDLPCFLKQAPNLKKVILHLITPSEEATDEELLGNHPVLSEYIETIVMRSEENTPKFSYKDFECTHVDHMENNN